MKMYEIEDLGAFGVWWYRGVVYRGGESTWWAYALRSDDGASWNTSRCVSDFASRDEAIAAAREATGVA